MVSLILICIVADTLNYASLVILKMELNIPDPSSTDGFGRVALTRKFNLQRKKERRCHSPNILRVHIALGPKLTNITGGGFLLAGFSGALSCYRWHRKKRKNWMSVTQKPTGVQFAGKANDSNILWKRIYKNTPFLQRAALNRGKFAFVHINLKILQRPPPPTFLFLSPLPFLAWFQLSFPVSTLISMDSLFYSVPLVLLHWGLEVLGGTGVSLMAA